jgi:hypothetical protein
VDLDNPLAPRVTATLGAPALNDPRGIALQFRYAFVVDREGLKVLDATDLAQPKPVANALVPLEDARNVYVARTYAYVSAGKQGLAIVDVEKPDAPKLDQLFTADGQLNDVNDAKVGMVAASAFAFVADGKNGLRILQVISPWDDPAHFSGFSPRPVPKLIATARTRGPALAISKGIDRDRAVDESGNQLGVFGRRGARPLNRAETQALYLRSGQLYSVTDEPAEQPQNGQAGAQSNHTWMQKLKSWFLPSPAATSTSSH